ncbi:MAG: ABC transporter ATP-binding protein [Candidatus Marinimicrobia bacterium]|jgi:ABC-type lipoprotein export system ATPase subunit|nr:ABC transporter ATP-binding protein [Candidatus Neomarinimicrobiota bacterium]MBT3496705.1 ABC transporter ATP-binding protein [Candidatus Neomarinimicrobiota bacterium]MBT3692300.1 ABC transporter ATP-binding protein [Candidatus Neomarinimicrobiota bacterium]MBT3732420.1 ABC transporter ATP-binding protein [Candidatus Neomarinimicrobiota bacterium]MBT4144590.1 ABC transporter ATP-binding protein [Candidatus Neomarinimicrobiota bacterium]
MILEAKNINKTYENGENTLCVLDELNLTVDKSEIITIMGESGSGKSTLLNILGTLDHPDKGEVYIQGKNVTTLPEIELAELRNCHIGFVFQFHHLLPEFTAYENILMPAMISGNEAEKRKEVDDLLAFVDLGNRKNHLPSELSGGERLRIAVLRSMINRPEVILADEPTGNLDAKNAKKMIDLFHKINQEYEQSIVITTHSQEVGAIGHRQFDLMNGKLQGKG